MISPKCLHPRAVTRSEADGCFWLVCVLCGHRGPRKHSRPLARARFRSVGVEFRGAAKRVLYTRTAARDDARFRVRSNSRTHQEKAR